MSKFRVFLTIGILPLLMMLSPTGHAKVPSVNDYSLNAEIQALLIDKSSPGECYSAVRLPSFQKKQGFIINPDQKPIRSGKWVRVICEADMTPNFLYWLEIRLSHLGLLDKQDIFTEGVKVNLDERLYAAIEKFQVLRDLPISGLSHETMNALSDINISSQPKSFKATK